MSISTLCRLTDPDGWRKEVELIDHNVIFEPPSLNSNGKRNACEKDCDSDDEFEPFDCGCGRLYLEGPICADDSCPNFASRTECSNRSCDERCRNMRLQKREMVDTEVISAGDKGWGLRLASGSTPIRKGQFIAEYVGEVIDAKEMTKRMTSHGRGISKLYMMQLGNGKFLDARNKGGVTRFINHSCDPSCVLEHWRVERDTRCAIFALKDIEAGEEVTFDYQWQHRPGRARTKCLCGTQKCRGTLEISDPETGRGETMNGFRTPTPEEANNSPGLIGCRVSILWPMNQAYFVGVVQSYDLSTQKHTVVYEADGEVHEESLLSREADSTTGVAAVGEPPWLLWDENLADVAAIKRKDRPPPMADPVAIEATLKRRQEEKAKNLAQAAPTPLLLRRHTMMGGKNVRKVYRQYFVLEDQVAVLLQDHGAHIHRFEAEFGVRLIIDRTLHPKAVKFPGRVMKAEGGDDALDDMFECMEKRNGVKPISMIEWKAMEEAAASRNAVSGVNTLEESTRDQQQQQQQRTCALTVERRNRFQMWIGWNWQCRGNGLVLNEGAVNDSVAARHLTAFSALERVGNAAGIDPSGLFHAAILLQRYFLVEQGASTTILNVTKSRPGAFTLATACLRIAGKTLRARVPFGRAPKTSTLLCESYGEQFPGKTFLQGTKEAEQWGARLLRCESFVEAACAFDLYLNDPFAAMKLIACQIPSFPTGYEKNQLLSSFKELALKTAVSGLSEWLTYPEEVMTPAVMLIVLTSFGEVQGKEWCEKTGIINGLQELLCNNYHHSIWPCVINCAISIMHSMRKKGKGGGTGSLTSGDRAYSTSLEALELMATFDQIESDALFQPRDSAFMPEACEAIEELRVLQSDCLSDMIPFKMDLHHGNSLPCPIAFPSAGRDSLDTLLPPPPSCGKTRLFFATISEDDLISAGLNNLLSSFPEPDAYSPIVAARKRATTQNLMHQVSETLDPPPTQRRVVCVQRCSSAEKDFGALSALALSELSVLQKLHASACPPHGHRSIIRPLAGLVGIEQGSSSFVKDIRHNSFVIIEPVRLTLSDLLRVCKPPLPPLQCPLPESLIYDLLSAVAFCHSNGILVRSLDPKMVLIGLDGRLKLGGLGSAQFIGSTKELNEHRKKKNITNKSKCGSKNRPEASQHQQPSEPLGNLLTMMAPELLLGSKDYSVASDLWCVACLAMHICLGKPLFSGRDQADQVRCIFSTCGTPSRDYWPAAYSLPLFHQLHPRVKPKQKQQSKVSLNVNSGHGEQLEHPFLRCKPRLDKVLAAELNEGRLSEGLVPFFKGLFRLQPEERLDTTKALTYICQLGVTGPAEEIRRRIVWGELSAALDKVDHGLRIEQALDVNGCGTIPIRRTTGMESTMKVTEGQSIEKLSTGKRTLVSSSEEEKRGKLVRTSWRRERERERERERVVVGCNF